MDLDLLTNIFYAMVRTGTPLLLVALGELVCEKSGVLNLGQEGMMLFGAVFTYWDVHMRPGSDSPALRMLIGGVLLLLSRALLLLKLVSQMLGSPSSQ
jgi:simple sugar transport system permease protein